MMAGVAEYFLDYFLMCSAVDMLLPSFTQVIQIDFKVPSGCMSINSGIIELCIIQSAFWAFGADRVEKGP